MTKKRRHDTLKEQAERKDRGVGGGGGQRDERQGGRSQRVARSTKHAHRATGDARSASMLQFHGSRRSGRERDAEMERKTVDETNEKRRGLGLERVQPGKGFVREFANAKG